jgi:hypothetical protein
MITPMKPAGARDARRCLIASLVLFLGFAVEAQFYDPGRPLPSLLALGAITIGLWAIATLGALIIYGVIAAAWATAKWRNLR